MIDLNLRKEKKQEEEDAPAGLIILSLMPFCLLFFWLFVRAL